VIEAGPQVSGVLGIDVPGLKGSTLGGTYDWSFLTTPQPGLNGRPSFWSRGKVLGGSSALNFLVYDRGSEIEYAWDKLGNSGPPWNWDVLFPEMQKSVNFTGPNTGNTAPTKGPVHATVPRYVPAQQQPFIPTVASLGIPTNTRSQEGNPIGVEFQPSTIDATNYNRSWAANSYLPLAGKGVTVLTNTRVAKINFKQTRAPNSASGSSRRSSTLPPVPTQQQATGITLQDGTTITAMHEVILSAGSVQSPGLLELSGIGQPCVITALSTKPKVLLDLPGVGENLQDHLRVQTSYQLKPNFTSFDKVTYNSTFSAEQLNLWFAGKTSIFDYNGSGFIFADWALALGKSSASKLLSLAKGAANASNIVDATKLSWLGRSDVSQLEVFFADGYTGSKGYPAAGSPLYGQGFSTLLGVILHPFAKGSIHLNTSASDPLSAPPVINPNYLNNKYDVQALVEISKFLRKVATTKPLSDVFVTEYEPGYDVIPNTPGDANDALWASYVQNVTDTLWHPCGTLAMLPQSKNGVVDGNLRVYGTSGLRVVDASVIPVIVGAHMQSLVYGIAERAAELIIGDWDASGKSNGADAVAGPESQRRWPWEEE
jgi:choline dehydrogenase-like flavoprotein